MTATDEVVVVVEDALEVVLAAVPIRGRLRAPKASAGLELELELVVDVDLDEKSVPFVYCLRTTRGK